MVIDENRMVGSGENSVFLARNEPLDWTWYFSSILAMLGYGYFVFGRFDRDWCQMKALVEET